jgi:hypothetical protein
VVSTVLTLTPLKWVVSSSDTTTTPILPRVTKTYFTPMLSSLLPAFTADGTGFLNLFFDRIGVLDD